MAIPQSELNRLLEASVADKTHEADFFRALLDATVYAHCPATDRSGKIRFIQFHGPDGELLLPFFSDLGKAKAAGSRKVRIVSVSGREFLASTQGATLVLNPNNHWCKLYPEEVGRLLSTGMLPVLSSTHLDEDLRVACKAPSVLPEGLVKHLIGVFEAIDGLEAAYLVEMVVAEQPTQPTQPELVIALVSSRALSERITRAVISGLQFDFPAPEVPLSAVSVDAGEPLPGWLMVDGLSPFYARTASTS